MPRHKEADRNQIQRDTRQRLLDAATQEFARKGYEGANIDRISGAAGYAKGTVYNYFPSKRALMLALLDGIASGHLDFMVERIMREKDPRQRLERFFEAGFAFVTDHLPQAQVMINILYGHDAEFKSHMWEIYQPMFRLVSQDIVAQGVSRGVFRHVDPQATSILLMTVYLGTVSQLNEVGKTWLDYSQVADFALNALMAPQSDPH